MRRVPLIAAALGALGALGASAPAAADALLVLAGEDVAARSSALGPFAEAKRARGWDVTVVSVEETGAAGLAGQGRALAIRAWLASNTAPGSSLLLLGDADPDYGDVPFFRVWPRHDYPEDQCGPFSIDCRSCLTDYLYGELTGDWDLDGDGALGETGDDEGTGGMEFAAELVVGRIPVVLGNVEDADRALRRAIAYMEADPAAVGWRSRALLAASFFYFRGQPMIVEDDDGAAITDWFERRTLAAFPEIAATAMYEQEGVVVSAYPSDLPLTQEGFVAEWAQGYGMVFWAGHGLERDVARTVWAEDADGDERADMDEVVQPTLIESADAASLPADRPAFVVGVSCEIGSVEVPDSLAERLLVEGGAVGVVGSTSVTPGSLTDYAGDAAAIDASTFGADNAGIAFFEALASDVPAGAAFDAARRELGTAGGVEPYAGKLMLNYFGDPTLGLYDTRDDVLPGEAPASASGCAAAPAPAGARSLLAALL